MTQNLSLSNREIIRLFYEDIFSNNKLDEVHRFVSKDCKMKDDDEIIDLGVDGMIQHMKDIRKTYPDFVIKVVKQYTDNDYVISEIVAEGTHKGEWLGMKPSHKKLRFTGVDIDLIKDGKIIEHGGAINTFETLFEAGIIEPT